MLVNTLSIFAALLGTYLLARRFFPRPVGVLAALILGLNASFIFVGHLFQNHILFIALALWCVLAYLNLIRRPTILSAVVLGVLLIHAFFTRAGGVGYPIFFLPSPRAIPPSAAEHARGVWVSPAPA